MTAGALQIVTGGRPATGPRPHAAGSRVRPRLRSSAIGSSTSSCRSRRRRTSRWPTSSSSSSITYELNITNGVDLGPPRGRSMIRGWKVTPHVRGGRLPFPPSRCWKRQMWSCWWVGRRRSTLWWSRCCRRTTSRGTPRVGSFLTCSNSPRRSR